MPGLVLHVGAQVSCFHALGKATLVSGAPRVQVGGLAVATVTSMVVAPGCPFQVPAPSGTKPQPCVKIQWSNVSARVKALGQSLLLQAPPGPGPGAGVCQSAEQIPQGVPKVDAMQVRVSAM